MRSHQGRGGGEGIPPLMPFRPRRRRRKRDQRDEREPRRIVKLPPSTEIRLPLFNPGFLGTIFCLTIFTS